MFRESQTSQVSNMQILELMREGFAAERERREKFELRIAALEEKSAAVELVQEIKQDKEKGSAALESMVAALEEMKPQMQKIQESNEETCTQVSELKEKHDKLAEHYKSTVTWLKQTLGEKTK